MKPISIKMLGRFDILVDGNSSLPYIGNSPKGISLLKYLLLQRGKAVPVPDLIDLFWSDPDKNNPESALKTMVSRLRSSLSKASPHLKNCILSEKRAYLWNPSISCEIDVFEFEELCRVLEGKAEFDDLTHEKFVRIFDLYEGDLAYANSDEEWLVSRSLYLHHLYVKTVHKFIAFLKEKEDFDSVIHVCRVALDVDSFDETLNLELMQALMYAGQNSAALVQYHHITGAYYKYLGIDPSARIQNFYKALIKADLAEESDIHAIRTTLTDISPDEDGAFVCEYSIFKDLYQLQLRNLERVQQKIFLGLVTISTSAPETLIEPMILDGIMRELLFIFKQCLRKGDIVTRYSPSQYAILFSMITYSDGHIVMRRIKNMFYERFSESNIRISFQFSGLEDTLP